MKLPRPTRFLVHLAALLLAGVAASPAAADSHNPRCGGKSAYLDTASRTVTVMVTDTNEDDLYGGDRRYSACYGRHGKTRELLQFRSPQNPGVARAAFSQRSVALEFEVTDGSCGKYLPDPCETRRTLGAWNSETGRLISQVSLPARTQGLAVSPTGAVVWIEQAPTPATGKVVRYLRGFGLPVTVGSGEIRTPAVFVGRTEIRWTDAAGPQTVPLPS